MAIPPPMVPAPMTAARRSGRAFTRFRPGTFVARRSEKKMCWSALDCPPEASSLKRAASRFSPASKVLASAAARTASTTATGATRSLAAFFVSLATVSKKPAGVEGTFRLATTRLELVLT